MSAVVNNKPAWDGTFRIADLRRVISEQPDILRSVVRVGNKVKQVQAVFQEKDPDCLTIKVDA